MRRCGLFRLASSLIAGLLLLVATAGPASAQDAVDIAEQVDFRGYYIEEGATADLNRLEALVGRADATDQNWYFVSLAEIADGGNDFFADAVQEQLTNSGTVIVVSPEGDGVYDVGVVSADYDDGNIADGLDDAVDLIPFPGDATDRFEAIFTGLNAQPANGAGSGSGIGAAGLLLPVLGIGGLVGGGLWYSNRKKEQEAAVKDENDVEAARSEIKSQLDAVANYVIDKADYVDTAGNAKATEYYQAATATFAEVDELLPRTTNLLELAKLNDRIDYARWQMEAAEALIEGRDVPAEPEPDKPVACFFDPTHKPGTELAVVKTAAGDKEVNVCAADAEKLRRGERPEPRMIDVHGRRVPAARAPRSHGGLGYGGIDIFDVVLGGMGGAMGRTRRRAPTSFPGAGGGMFDWTPTGSTRSRQTRRRSPGGVFGPDRVPRRTPTSSRPRRTSGGGRARSRRTSGGKRRTSGRGRRRM